MNKEEGNHNENDMKSAFEGFDADLKDLNPATKEKAKILAAQLLKKHGYDKKRAREEAIREAEAWFLDMEG